MKDQYVSNVQTNKQFDPSNYIEPGLTERDIIQIKEVFDSMDLDGNGMISPLDLRASIFNFAKLNPKQNTTFHIIAEYDMDLQGELTFEDFLRIANPDKNKIPETSTDIQKCFEEYDQNNKGYIDLKDLERMVKFFGENFSTEEIEEIFNKCSSNGQYISAEDFFNIMTKGYSQINQLIIMNKTNSLVYILTALNLVLLSSLIYQQLKNKKERKRYNEILEIQKKYNYDDLMPNIVYSKDDKVDAIFREVMDKKNKNIENCINPNVRKLSKRTKALLTCLPLFKEYKLKAKPINKKLLPSIPNYVPKFGEYNKIQSSSYPFKKINWKKLYKNSWLYTQNIISKLGFYQNKVTDEMHNDDPTLKPDYEIPHMGIFNDPNYCHVHDIMLLSNQKWAFKKYFMTDYHQMSLVRMFVMNKIGQDLMPRFSKNMPKINWYQKLYSIDPRINMFFFKNASFHTHHQIGKNFVCYGQSYNHIPGHGGITRKDLMAQLTEAWMKKFEKHPQCKVKMNFFPKAYRLYVREECKQFFEYLSTKEYEEHKKKSPIQFIIKVGHGVHRGLGVYIFDQRLEKTYREEYENGKKCGFIHINEIAQQYIGNTATFKGHKFDLRVYMLVSSVNPLRVYYHDGFLRVSLKKYDKFSTIPGVHITNTSQSAKIIEQVEQTGQKYLDMDAEQLKDFQYQSLEDYAKYLLETNQIDDPNWLNNVLIPKIKQSFVSSAKLVEDKLYKSSNVYEMFGVDIVVDEDFNLSIIEINASPMIIGTAIGKTKMMKNMVKGLFNIIYAQQFSRMKRTLQYVEENKEEISKAKNIQTYKDKFNELYENNIDEEYQHMLQKNPWSLIYDESVNDKYGKYMGLIDKDCIDLIEDNNQIIHQQ